MPRDDFSKAIAYMSFSSLGFAFMQLMLVYAGDIPVYQKVLFRNLVGFFFALYFLWRRGKPLLPQKSSLKLLTLRSIFGTFGMSFYVFSLSGLTMADGAMLNKMSPFFVIVFAALLLKEKVTKVKALALLGAFSGALFIIKPDFSVQTIFALSGFTSAIFAGLAYVFVRMLRAKESPLMVVMFFSFFSSLVMLVPTLYNFTPLAAKEWLFLIGAGVFAFLGQYTMTQAYALAPAGEISIYSYLMVAFSVILGLLLFQEVPDIWSFLGIGLVVLSAYYLYYKEVVVLRKNGGSIS